MIYLGLALIQHTSSLRDLAITMSCMEVDLVEEEQRQSEIEKTQKALLSYYISPSTPRPVIGTLNEVKPEVPEVAGGTVKLYKSIRNFIFEIYV